VSHDIRLPAALTRGTSALPRRRRLTGALVAAVGIPAITVVLTASRDALSLSSVLLIYLLTVVAIATIGGAVVGIAAATTSALCANYYFTQPLHTFRVRTKDDVVALVVYVTAAAVVSTLVEIAARRRAAALRANELAQIDEVRSALLAAVGHDLRTPLAGIKAAVSTLRQDDVAWSPEEHAELLATIEESADQLAELLENLLDMSRLQAGVMSVQLRDVALEEVVLGALPRSDEHRVEVNIPDDLPLVSADPGLLDRAIANLAANALRFSPTDRPVAITADAAYDLVRLHIADHGPGIPTADHERIFAPFQRLGDHSRSNGLGLGLAISRGFVEAMGGGISASDTPGGGLTMTITLRGWT
jgi:two-component system sensor histidine kinase KdpD